MRLEYLFDFGLDLSLIAYEHFNRYPTYYWDNGRLALADKKLQSYAMSFTYAFDSLVLRGDSLKTLKQPSVTQDFLYTEKDKVVDISEIVKKFELYGSKDKKLLNLSQCKDHIMAGDILSPDTTPLLRSEIVGFLKKTGIK